MEIQFRWFEINTLRVRASAALREFRRRHDKLMQKDINLMLYIFLAADTHKQVHY